MTLRDAVERIAHLPVPAVRMVMKRARTVDAMLVSVCQWRLGPPQAWGQLLLVLGDRPRAYRTVGSRQIERLVGLLSVSDLTAVQLADRLGLPSRDTVAPIINRAREVGYSIATQRAFGVTTYSLQEPPC